MPQFIVNSSQRIALAIATGLALLLGAVFLKQYLMLIILSAIAAILFNPLYHRFVRAGRRPGTAATLTFFVSIFMVIIPIIFVSVITILQINQLVSDITSGNYSINLKETATPIIDHINAFFSSAGLPYTITLEGVANAIAKAAQQFGRTVVEGIVSSLSSFLGLITTSIIYLYVFISMLVNQEKIIRTLKNLNPLGDTISDLYIHRVDAMTKATVRGQFIIAFFQGTASAIGLAIAGLPQLFFFFWILLTIMSIVPLGAGILTIPIGIGMILTGNIWQGVLVILNHLVVVTNIDNFLRPILVPRSARLDPALMILAVFAGMGAFGFIGIVVGPVIMILIVTTIQLYLEIFRNTASIEVIKDQKRRGLLSRLRFWKKPKVPVSDVTA